jgi:hypothetical protein
MAAAGLKEGQLTPPVEVEITSATDEPLVHYRLTSLEHGGMEILQSDESKWQSPEVFPVTATITDGAGKVEMWKSILAQRGSIRFTPRSTPPEFPPAAARRLSAGIFGPHCFCQSTEVFPQWRAFCTEVGDL